MTFLYSLTGAGQSLTGDLCRHRVFPTSKPSPSTKACTMDRPVPHFHVRWCAKGACGLLGKLPGVYPKLPFWNAPTMPRRTFRVRLCERRLPRPGRRVKLASFLRLSIEDPERLGTVNFKPSYSPRPKDRQLIGPRIASGPCFVRRKETNFWYVLGNHSVGPGGGESLPPVSPRPALIRPDQRVEHAQALARHR